MIVYKWTEDVLAVALGVLAVLLTGSVVGFIIFWMGFIYWMSYI